MVNYSDGKDYFLYYFFSYYSQSAENDEDPLTIVDFQNSDSADDLTLTRSTSSVPGSSNEYNPYEVTYTILGGPVDIDAVGYYGPDSREKEYFATDNFQSDITSTLQYIFTSYNPESNDMLIRDVANVTFTSAPTSSPGMIAALQLNSIYTDRDGSSPFLVLNSTEQRPALSKYIDDTAPQWSKLVTNDILFNVDAQVGDVFKTSLWGQLTGAPDGSNGFKSVLEEVTQTLGADVYSLGGGKTVSGLPNGYDNQKYSITAYPLHPEMIGKIPYFGPTLLPYYVFPHTLQLMDIAVLQDQYGRNFDKKAGDTLWTPGSMVAAGQSIRSPFLYTIWDGAGDDTLDMSGTEYDSYYNNSVQLDLRQGHFSSIGTGGSGNLIAKDSGNTDFGNVAIAFYSVIENARGTKWGDTLIGNAWDNKLYGGAGNDKIYGDGVAYNNDAGFHEDDPQRPSSNPQVSAAADDSGVDTLYGGTGADEVYGGKGDDILIAEAGAPGFFSKGSLEGDLYHGGGNNVAFADDGMDTLDYSGVSIGGITIEKTTSESEFKIYRTSDIIPTKDTAISIEKFILTSDSDAVSFEDDLPTTSTTFEAGDGEQDKIDFSGSSQGITVNPEDSQGYRSIGTIKFKEFEIIVGSATANDVYKGGYGAITFDGGGHVANSVGDTADYSGMLDPSGQSGLPTLGYVLVDMTSDLVEVGTNLGRRHYEKILNVETYVGSHGDDFFRAKEGINGITFDGFEGTGDVVDFTAFTTGITMNLGVGTSDFTVLNIEEIYGTAFDDVFFGTSGNERFYALGGQDIVSAGGGNDFIDSGSGDAEVDYLDGEGGDDIFYFRSSDTVLDLIEGGGGSDTVFLAGSFAFDDESFFTRDGSTGAFTIDGVAVISNPNTTEYVQYSDTSRFSLDSLGHELPDYDPYNVVTGTPGNDAPLDGTGANDFFTSSGGIDAINGGGGHDIVNYSNLGHSIDINLTAGVVVVSKTTLGDEYDTLSGIEGFWGTDFGDTFLGDSADNEYVGGTGNDDLRGGDGGDILYSGGGIDVLSGEGGNDWIFGAGFGVLSGGDGSDHLYAASADFANGGNGEDFLYGGSDAILDGGAGNDYLEGSGNVLYYESSGTDVFNDAGNGILALTSTSIGLLEFYKAENGSTVLVKPDGDAIVLISEIGTIRSGSTDYDFSTYIQTQTVRFLDADHAQILAGTLGNTVYDSTDNPNDTVLSVGGTTQYLFDDSDFKGSTSIVGAQGGLETIVLENESSQDSFSLIRNVVNPNTLSLYYGAGEIVLQDVSNVASAYQVELGQTSETFALTSLDFVTRGSFLNDQIYGDLSGFSPDDVIFGEDGDDELFGGDGLDSLYGGIGNDMLFGEAGDDTLDGGEGDDEVDGGDGFDTLVDSQGNDTYIITTNDTLFVGSGDNVIETSLADLSTVTLDFSAYGYIGSASQGIDPGFVRDFATVDVSDYKLYYGGSSLTIENYSNLTIAPSVRLVDDTEIALNEFIVVGYGSDASDGYNEQMFLPQDDYVFALDGDDAFNFMDGNDTVFGGAGNDYLIKIATYSYDPGTGTWSYVTGSGDFTAYGEEGDDILQGGSGDDFLDGGAGADQLISAYGGGTDVLFGGAGDDLLGPGASGASILDGGEGTDTVALFYDYDPFGPTHSYTIDLDAETVSRDGGGTQHTLVSIENAIGGYGDDVIYGNGDANHIEGFEGDDTLEGGAGSDVYWFGSGVDEGEDVITEGGGPDDSIQFYEGVTVDDLFFTVSGTDLEIDHPYGLITISNQLLGGSYLVENLVFADGTTLDLNNFSLWSIADDTDNTSFTGTSGADILYGLGGNDVVSGLGDSDKLHGGEGDDSLDGGDGDDILEGGVGDDTLNGGTGSDTASYQSSAQGVVVNLITGSASDGFGGTDSLTSIENVKGSLLDDIFVSDAGANTFDGAQGSDTVDYSGSTSKVTIDLENGTASDGFAQGDILISIENIIGSDLGAEGDTIYGDANTNAITGLDGDDILEGAAGADVIDGGDGWDVARYTRSAEGVYVNLELGANVGGDAQGDILLNIEAVTGSDYDDVLYGSAGANELRGGAGHDYIDGGDGVDKLRGGDGDDTLYAGAGNDQDVNAEAGNDTLYGGDGDDKLRGGDGDDTVLGEDGNDFLYGDNDDFDTAGGNDIVDGGAGDDSLRGGFGDDIYIASSGTDDINDLGGVDTIAYGIGVSIQDLTIASVSGDNNDIAIVLGTDQIVIENQLDTAGSLVIENLAFADGSYATLARVEDWIYTDVAGGTANGFSVADTIIGDVGDDTINGRAGNDELFGGDGDDILRGGEGDDELHGGGGTNTAIFSGLYSNYVFSGNTIEDTVGTDGTDTYFYIQTFKFYDGTFENGVFTASATDDTLTATAAADILDGAAGNDTADYSGSNYAVFVDLLNGTASGGYAKGDTLVSIENLIGSAYGDTLSDDLNDNSLSGGLGDDIYVYRGGLDTVTDTGGSDILVLENATIQNTSFAFDNNDLLITINASTDEVRIIDHALSASALELIRFSDGFEANLADITNWVFSSTSVNGSNGVDDTIILGAAADTSYGYSGNDHIHGGDGADILRGNEGADMIFGGAGDDDLKGDDDNDILNGGDGVDKLRGGLGDDILYAGAGDDTDVRAEDGDDTVYGGDGNDTLYGDYNSTDTMAGNDILDGGNGDDTLRGGLGNDLYIASNGDDYIYDRGGNDSIRFGSGISIFDLAFSNDPVDTNDQIITFGANTLLIENQTDSAGSYVIETLLFADGTYANYANILDWDFATTGGGTIHGSYSADDTMIGNIGKDSFYGKDGNDQLFGGTGNDYLRGDAGNDILVGGSGDDDLKGDGGDDMLYAGAGADRLEGHAGADSYIFQNPEIIDGNLNRVVGFSQADGDTIILEHVLQGFDPLTDVIGDFITMHTTSHTYLSIDADGQGEAYSMTADVIRIENITAWSSVDDMIAQGDLLLVA